MRLLFAFFGADTLLARSFWEAAGAAPRLGQVVSRLFFLLLSSLQPCFTAPYPARPLRVDSSVADPSLAFRVLNGGPSCPIGSTIDSSSNGHPQGAALQTFLQRRKNGRGSLAPQPAVHWLGAPGSVPLLLPEVRLRGSPTKAESNSHPQGIRYNQFERLGRETVVLVRWIFPPVCSYCTPCVKRVWVNSG